MYGVIFVVDIIQRNESDSKAGVESMIFPVQQTRTTVRLFTCFICDTPYVQLSNDLSNAKNVMRNKKGRLITKLFEA